MGETTSDYLSVKMERTAFTGGAMVFVRAAVLAAVLAQLLGPIEALRPAGSHPGHAYFEQPCCGHSHLRHHKGLRFVLVIITGTWMLIVECGALREYQSHVTWKIWRYFSCEVVFAFKLLRSYFDCAVNKANSQICIDTFLGERGKIYKKVLVSIFLSPLDFYIYSDWPPAPK